MSIKSSGPFVVVERASEVEDMIVENTSLAHHDTGMSEFGDGLDDLMINHGIEVFVNETTRMSEGYVEILIRVPVV